jgi:hypothetical protein
MTALHTILSTPKPEVDSNSLWGTVSLGDGDQFCFGLGEEIRGTGRWGHNSL